MRASDNGWRAVNAPRTARKAGRGRERETERVRGCIGKVLKMQAGSVDLAAEMLCKKRHRRWRAKGRIERQASTESGTRTSTGAVIRYRPKPAAGSYGLNVPAIQMPRSGRACRLENKLPDGSLGTIFFFARHEPSLCTFSCKRAQRTCVCALFFRSRTYACALIVRRLLFLLRAARHQRDQDASPQAGGQQPSCAHDRLIAPVRNHDHLPPLETSQRLRNY